MNQSANKNNWKSKIAFFAKEYTVALMLLAIIVFMTIVRSETFFNASNFMNVIRVSSIVGIMACGLTCVMIFSGFDLSVGMIMSFSGVMCIMTYTILGPLFSILFALLCGTVLGAINGVILSLIKGGVGETFIITLGMQGVLYSAGMLITNGAEIRGPDDAFFIFLGKGFVFGIAFPIIVFIVIAILTGLFLRHTTLGRKFYLIGGNKTAAKLSGIRVEKYRVVVFAISGFCAAVAGIILASRTLAGSMRVGQGYEFDTISAIVIGGTSLYGGEGGIVKTIFGVLMVSFLLNSLNLLGVASQWQYVAKGIVVLLAVGLDMLKKRMEGR